jgi:hypothetical protein
MSSYFHDGHDRERERFELRRREDVSDQPTYHEYLDRLDGNPFLSHLTKLVERIEGRMRQRNEALK